MPVHSRRLAGFSLLAATILVVCACGSGSKTTSTAVPTTTPAHPTSALTTWSLPGADPQNSRDVGGPINASNVSTLGVAWTVPINAHGLFGSYATTPVVAGGVVYTQDLDSNVQAIDLTSGRIIWSHKYNSPDEGPNGVTFANGKLYGATNRAAFALDAATGKQLWTRTLIRNASEGIDMAPGYNDGTVYVSTVPGNPNTFYAGNGQGVLWALDASTGATKWKFDEVPVNLWSAAHMNINSGGGLWNPPTFDSEGNLYIGVANPAPFTGSAKFPWGSSRPGPDVYTDSVVKLDANTGKLIWYYQLTPHDIYDYDLENSPILADANGRQIVIDAGKAGILVAVDAQSGKPVWKRSVGVHNGHQNDNLLAENGDFSKLHIPETVEPGDLGGVESQLASNGTTVFAAVNNLPWRYKSQGLTGISPAVPYDRGTGEVVAVDEATGNVRWDHKLTSSPYGAATITNNVVFTTTFDGTLHAFNASTGAELWHTALSSTTNAPVAVVGNTVLTAASFPSAAGHALIIAYRLGADGKLPAPTTKAPPAPTRPPAKGSVQISTRTIPGLGPVLVNGQGRTLYLFLRDHDRKVTCVGSCAEVWPPAFLPNGNRPVASGLVKQALLGSDPDPAGGRVVTYAGWPLYTFISDSAPGTATGQGLNLNGGLWYVLSPSGRVIKTKR
jgi:outer membrane protein assembly factor BamB/predicted lipoprotein with Yx(FWY)xxD motif